MTGRRWIEDDPWDEDDVPADDVPAGCAAFLCLIALLFLVGLGFWVVQAVGIWT